MFYPDKNFINTLSNGERFIFLKIIAARSPPTARSAAKNCFI